MNGPHAKLCQCRSCADIRFDAFTDRMKAFVRETGAKPNNPAQTVMVRQFTVRAHWRRNPRHMTADDALRKRVDSYFHRYEPKNGSNGAK